MPTAPDTNPRGTRFVTPLGTPAAIRVVPNARGNPPGTVWDGEAISDPVAAMADRDWHDSLLALLGRLEAGRAALTEPTGDPAIWAATAAAMVTVAAIAFDDARRPNARQAAIDEARAAVLRFRTHAAGTRRGPFKLFATAPTRATIDHLVQELPVVLEQCFAVLGAGFHGADAALRWVDASGLFLTELRRNA
jgi:hypothetical protein